MENGKVDIHIYESSYERSMYATTGVLPCTSIRSTSGKFCTSCHSEENPEKTHECISVESVVRSGDHKNSEEPKAPWTNRQWVILITSMIANFGCSVCISLQAPFFPAEATRKGVRPAVYGFVFGAFSLTVFLLAPFFGKYIGKIGARFMMNSGLFVTAFCCILFGFLDRIHNGNTFITFAFLVRIVEAMGDASFHTANFAVMASNFPQEVGKSFAFLRAAFGIGLIVGPTIGGILYQWGGYSLPFVVMGVILLLLTCISTYMFKNDSDENSSETTEPSLLKALCVPTVCLAMFAVCVGALSIGFLSATLEPHLRQFNLTPIEVGAVFVISGGVYALTTVLWGWLCDGKVSPKILIAIGGFFLSITYLLIGPTPFFPFNTKLWLIVVALGVHGFGLGAELLASHIEALNEAMANGFPRNYQTFGMISGLWAAFFQLGNFIGPSLGGILYDQIGFRQATIVLLSLQLSLIVANVTYTLVVKKRTTGCSGSPSEKRRLI